MSLFAPIRRLSSFLWPRWVRRLLPQTLFGRTLLIIVLPTLLTLIVATFVFFDRHWYATTLRLTQAVAGDVAVVVELLEDEPDKPHSAQLIKLAQKKMDLSVSFKEGGQLLKGRRRDINPLRVMLSNALADRLRYPHRVMAKEEPNTVVIQVETPRGLYVFQIPQRRIYTPTTEVFIIWMVGSSILLSAIALLFMRNQVRPVRRLADAAEAIGKGQNVPWFKPEGATEVRQAAAALMVMHDRIRRSVGQRTAMLAGVSHDLRTPLTRMKLQLAMMPENAQTRGFESDIADMERMLEAYLAFARGEDGEPVTMTDLAALIGEVVEAMKRQSPHISLAIESNLCLPLRPHAMKRCLQNLLSNALRYGKKAQMTLNVRDNAAEIVVEDDGPGIPLEKREDVFKPFLRLDASRNQDTGGVGLGLTIARDIARAHGGDITLEDSPLGGLRVRIRLPV